VIVDCAVYERGCRRPGTLALEEAYEACRAEDAFVWIGLVEPSADEFDSVRREFELHELAVEDAIEAHQRPKLEVYGQSLFVVLKTARYVDEALEFGEIMLFIGDGFVVSVRHGEASELHGVRLRVEERPDLLRAGTGAVLYAVLDRVVDDYEPVVWRLDAKVEALEEEAFTSGGRADLGERIYSLEREVLEFRRAIVPLREWVERLVRGGLPLDDGELRDYFRDVHDHLLREAERVDAFRDLLSTVLQANLIQVSVRQNEDMRRISAWLAIVAIPTIITGIYGMNFQNLPGNHSSVGLPSALALMIVVCVVLYRYFRRAGWL
jgi:magnesium transporter